MIQPKRRPRNERIHQLRLRAHRRIPRVDRVKEPEGTGGSLSFLFFCSREARCESREKIFSAGVNPGEALVRPGGYPESTGVRHGGI